MFSILHNKEIFNIDINYSLDSEPSKRWAASVKIKDKTHICIASEFEVAIQMLARIIRKTLE